MPKKTNNERLKTEAGLEQELRSLLQGDDLEPQHRLFCHEYIKHFNGSAAYIASGYDVSPAVARRSASRLLKQPNVQKYLNGLMQSIAAESELTQSWVLRWLKARVETTIVDVADVSAEGEITIKDLKQLPRHKVGCIQEISSSINQEGKPEIKIKLKSGDAELRLLARFTGVDSDWNNWLRVADKYGYEMRETKYGWQLIHQSKRDVFNERFSKIETTTISETPPPDDRISTIGT